VKELGEALKLIFAKVAGFFDIFDLSFFVLGDSLRYSVSDLFASCGFADCFDLGFKNWHFPGCYSKL